MGDNMKSRCTHWILAFCVALGGFAVALSAATVTTYPGPQGIAASTHFSVRVSDGAAWHSSFAYGLSGSDVCSGTNRYLSFTNFEMTQGSVTVEITNLQGNISSCVIRPKRYGVQPIVQGNTVTFTLTQPMKVEADLGSSTNLCYIFANPPDSGKPANTTYYYAPGVYDIGLLTMNANEIMYVAGGAYVKGLIHCGSGCQILGQGIISMENRVNVGSGYSQLHSLTTGGVIKNVTFTHPADPFLLNARDFTLIENAKFLAFPGHNRGCGVGGNGGIEVTGRNRPFTVKNCFIYGGDDACNSEGNTIAGCVVQDVTVASYAAGALGATWSGSVIGVTYQNCDIIATNTADYGSSQGFTYAMAPTNFGQPGEVSNLLFKNIIIEDDNTPLIRLLSYTANNNASIYNIVFENVTVEKPQADKSKLNGYSSARMVRDITFRNLKINGTYVTNANKSTYFQFGNFTSNIIFEQTATHVAKGPILDISNIAHRMAPKSGKILLSGAGIAVGDCWEALGMDGRVLQRGTAGPDGAALLDALALGVRIIRIGDSGGIRYFRLLMN